MAVGTPDFESWVDFCFTKSEDYSSTEPEHEEFLWIEPPVLADYLQTLFKNSWPLLSQYSLDQLGAGVWCIFGPASEYMAAFLRTGLPEKSQISVVQSLKRIYTDTFDRLCDDHGKRPATHQGDFNKFDSSVYMIWDMDGIQGATSEPHLIAPAFEVLEHATLCKTVACQISGLHGLNHQHHKFPDRVEALVDLFLEKQTSAMPWVREYALDAKHGNCL